MEQSNTFLLLINEIGVLSITLLMIAGFLFGIAYTYTHFWAIRKFVLKSPNFKKIIFIMTFVRLFIFAGALAIVARPNYPGVRIMLFFIGFMIGRVGLMAMAKKEIAK